MLLPVFLVFYVLFLLGVISLRVLRWAYVTLLVLGLLYFPASVGFRLDPHPCELTFGVALAVHSLTNYPHVVLFASFFLMTFLMTNAQFRISDWRAFAWTGAATIVMGALVEIAEGVSGKGHCRLRDLIPDAAGALLGAAVVLVWGGVRRLLKPSEAY
jgi:hypothetical protein